MVPGLSIVLPAWNEEPNIRLAVERSLSVLAEIAESYEVIVVDDGSEDQTAEVVRNLATERAPQVRLLSHGTNLGYGAAIRTGFDNARHDLIFYTDADNQFDVTELEYFLPLMDEHDLAIGFRVYRYDAVLRSIMSWIYNRLVGVLFRLHVRDVDCAFKLTRRDVLDHLNLECDDFFIDTELVVRARKWNYRIVQKGVRHYPRTAGQTTVLVSDVPRTLRTVFRMWQRIYFPTRGQDDEYAQHQERRRAHVTEHTPAA
jgi:glycosyltransferase involved in cell wall biosynthesis